MTLIPIFVIGIIASIITELVKLFPWFAQTSDRKRVMAFVISIMVSLIYVYSNPELANLDILTLLFGGIASAFLVYKTVIQTFTEPIKAQIIKAKKQIKSLDEA